MKTLYSLILAFGFLSFSSHPLADVMSGRLEGFTYTAKDSVFVTKLPSLQGEIRDFPNAVSVYSPEQGSQDSLEHYPVPEAEISKYVSQNPADYFAEFIRTSLIKRRYQNHFLGLKIINEKAFRVNDHDIYILTMKLPQASQRTTSEGIPMDLVVSLATMISGEKIYIFQVAVSPDNNSVTITDSNIDKILEWVKNTTFNG